MQYKNKKQIEEEINTCIRCKKSKPLHLFYRNNKMKNGYINVCKECGKKEAKKWRDKNKEKVESYIKKYRNKNIEKTKQDQHNWRKNNVEKTREYLKKYMSKPDYKSKKKKYRETHKEQIKENRKQYRLNNKVSLYLRSRLSKILKTKRINKQNSTMKYIGCSTNELKRHLEKQFTEGMSWDNYGKWHIDHIIPFNYYTKECGGLTEENLYKVMNYKNLQPLWAIDNLLKNGKYFSKT